MLNITDPEYILFKQYIEAHCGIYLENGKEYLIETRLSELAREVEAKSFQEFHFKARSDSSGVLKNKIIDAMTTNETSWFRDTSAWSYIIEEAVPLLFSRIIAGEKIRLWSAASSTGQETYTLAICVYEEALKKGIYNLEERVEILGTDISSSAVKAAKKGYYDAIAVSRGLPEEKKNRYFQKEGNFWKIKNEIKRIVQFKEYNLQNSFMPLGVFDIILCRYVTIYFSESFKRELFFKFAKVLKRPGDVLLLGATESLRGFSEDFDISYYKNAMINKRK